MLISADDVAAQMGAPALTDATRRRIEMAIEDVEALLADRFGRLDLVDPDRLQRVIRWTVAEWASQPGAGVLSLEVSVDDARTATRFSEGQHESLADILARFWDHLGSARRRRGAFSIAPAYQPDYRRDW